MTNENLKNPSVVAVPDAIDLDAAIARVQTKLASLSWLQKIFGRAREIPRKTADGKVERMPMVYTGNGEYYPAVPNDALRAFSFVMVGQPRAMVDYSPGNHSQRMSAPLALVVWGNLKQVDPALSHIFTETLINDVVRVLSRMPDVMIARVFDENIREIWRGLSVNESHLGLLMYPYFSFRIEFGLTYDVNCVTPAPEPEPEPLLDLKYNFGPDGMADVEGWTSVPFGGPNPDNLEPLPWNNTSNENLQVTNWAQAFTIAATDPLKQTHWRAASWWNAGFRIHGLDPAKQYTITLLGAVPDDDPDSDDGDVAFGNTSPDSAFLTDSNLLDDISLYQDRPGVMFTDADGPDGATEIVWNNVSPNAAGELFVVMGRGTNISGTQIFPVVSYLRVAENA